MKPRLYAIARERISGIKATDMEIAELSIFVGNKNIRKMVAKMLKAIKRAEIPVIDSVFLPAIGWPH